MMWRKLGEADEKEPLFQLFFLKNDEDQSVEVTELEEIDFREVNRRLKMGESVFITAKHKQTPESSLVKSQEDTPDSLYFLMIRKSYMISIEDPLTPTKTKYSGGVRSEL